MTAVAISTNFATRPPRAFLRPTEISTFATLPTAHQRRRVGNITPQRSEIETDCSRGQPTATCSRTSGSGISGPHSASSRATLTRPRRSHLVHATSICLCPAAATSASNHAPPLGIVAAIAAASARHAPWRTSRASAAPVSVMVVRAWPGSISADRGAAPADSAHNQSSLATTRPGRVLLPRSDQGSSQKIWAVAAATAAGMSGGGRANRYAALATSRTRSSTHRITGTAMALPRTRYRAPSAAGLPR